MTHRTSLVLMLFLTAFATSSVATSPVEYGRDAEAIAKQSKPIIEQGKDQVPLDQAQAIDSIINSTRQELPKDFVKEAAKLSRDAIEKMQSDHTFGGERITFKEKAVLKAKNSIVEGEKTYLFVSQSMGLRTLRDTLKALGGRKDVVMVFRGLNEDQSFEQLFRFMTKLKTGIDNPPPVVMDDKLFNAFGIESVPALVHVSDGGGSEENAAKNEQIRVLGIDRPDFLLEKLDEGVRGDLGKQGPVYAISELTFTEIIRRRITKIDWDAERKRAFQNAWQHIPIESLTPAPETRRRSVSAVVIATADITDSKGKIIIHKGTKKNQLEMIPWHGAIVVFDPENKKELQWVVAHRDKIERNYYPVKYLITQINRDQGWDDYRRIKTALDRHIYVLVPDVSNRFQLEHTISIVSADNEKKEFVVKEVKP